MNYAVTSKEKILFVISSLQCGGAEKVVVHLINHLDKCKYKAMLVLFENKLDYREDLNPYVKVVCLNKKYKWSFFKLILGLNRVMRCYKPKAVIGFLHYTNIITVLASIFLKRRFKLILSEHSNPSKYLPRARFGHLKNWLMKLTYKRADKIVAVSKGIEDLLKKDFNLRPENIKTIYNPIPLEEIRNRSKEHIEHSFFRDKEARVILSAGRLTEQKRFDRLLRAFSLVKEKQEKVYLIILGKGELHDKLETLAAALNIDRWVDFVGFKSNPYAWISKADIFILSSDWEGLPNVILEAMACGTPVISSDCPTGPNEIIANGSNGILVYPIDEKIFAQEILKLLQNEDLRIRLSDEGRKRAKDFSMEKILYQYEELF